jgi:hypothetical protein
MYASVRHYRMGAGSIDSLMHRGGEVFVSRVTAEALEDADRWAHGVRSRSP